MDYQYNCLISICFHFVCCFLLFFIFFSGIRPSVSFEAVVSVEFALTRATHRAKRPGLDPSIPPT